VVEGKSLENLKKKGRQLANEGAYGYVETTTGRVMFNFGFGSGVSHANAS
jgi:hypothetical protein